MFDRTLVIILLLTLALGLGGGVLVSYWLLKPDLGQDAARQAVKKLVWKRFPVLALVLGVVVALVLLLPKGWGDWLFAAFFTFLLVILWGVVIVQRPRKKKNAGAVLIDLGAPRSRSSAFMASVCLFMAVLRLAVFAADSDLADLAQAACLASLALILFAGGWRTSMVLAKGGILGFAYLLRWEQIAGFEWTGVDGNLLRFQTVWQVPLLKIPRRGAARLYVPPVHREAVDEILAQYIAQ